MYETYRIEMEKPIGWTTIVDINPTRSCPREVRLLNPNGQLAGRSSIDAVLDSGVIPVFHSDELMSIPSCVLSEIVEIESLPSDL